MPSTQPLDEAHDRVGPFVRLVERTGNAAKNVLCGLRGVERIPQEIAPPLLVSYAYRSHWGNEQPSAAYFDWVLDSGAFSAHNSGKTIVLADYITYCKERMAVDPTLVEIYALDVIGDWRASLVNTEKMWAAGVAAIPTFHYSEPEDVLRGLARDYPKIAVGGMATLRGATKTKFAEQCFARVWPKAVHGFAVTEESHVLGFPWSSVDSLSWAMGALRFGRWKAFGRKATGHLGHSTQDLRPEIEWYRKLQDKAQFRWHDELAALDYRTGKLRP